MSILDVTTIESETNIKEEDEKLEWASKLLLSLGEFAEEKRELRQQIQNLEYDLYKDELTGCYSRKWLHKNYLSGGTSVSK